VKGGRDPRSRADYESPAGVSQRSDSPFRYESAFDGRLEQLGREPLGRGWRSAVEVVGLVGACAVLGDAAAATDRSGAATIGMDLPGWGRATLGPRT
jgi:hypothetical protein